jgi:hypothetical protein
MKKNIVIELIPCDLKDKIIIMFPAKLKLGEFLEALKKFSIKKGE